MIRVVPDTNVLISATFWIGKSHQITKMAIEGSIAYFTSAAILDEYRRVLKRDFNQSEDLIQEKISRIQSFATLVSPARKINLITEDPDDNRVVEVALACGADFIITQDRHLLKHAKIGSILVVEPIRFLQLVKP